MKQDLFDINPLFLSNFFKSTTFAARGAICDLRGTILFRPTEYEVQFHRRLLFLESLNLPKYLCLEHKQTNSDEGKGTNGAKK